MDSNKKRVRDSQKSVASPSSESTKVGKVRFSLKDHLFNREKTEYLGALFAAKDSGFFKKVLCVQRDEEASGVGVEAAHRLDCGGARITFARSFSGGGRTDGGKFAAAAGRKQNR